MFGKLNIVMGSAFIGVEDPKCMTIMNLAGAAHRVKLNVVPIPETVVKLVRA